MTLPVADILNQLPAWGLVLVRLTGIFIFAPVFGSSAIPVRLKVLFAAGLACVIYPLLVSAAPATGVHLAAVVGMHGPTLWGLVPMIAWELFIGLLIGYGATLPLIGMQMAGQLIDQQMGLGIGGILNPDLDEQNGITAEIYFVAALAFFVICGGQRAILGTLLDSFRHVPLGGLHADGHVLALVLGLLASSCELALRVAAPLLCLVFLETAAMGFITRTVPQMNILSIGFPLRIIIGMAVLIGALTVQSGVFTASLHETLHGLQVLIGR